MKFHAISIFGFIVSLAIVVAAVIKWFFLYPVTTYLVFGIAFGIAGIIFSYIYNYMRNNDSEMDKLRRQYQAIVSMWTNSEKEDIENIAKGEKIE